MRAKDRDAVDLAGEAVGGGAAAAHVGGARHGEAAVRALGAAQAKVGDGVALGRLDHARGLGGHERLKVHEVEQGRLEQLAGHHRALHAHDRLAREHHVALARGPHVHVHGEVREPLEELGLEHGAAAGGLDAPEVGDVLVGVAEALHEVGDLAGAAGHGVAAGEWVVTEEDGEAGTGVAHARLPVALGHRELVEVGVERHVGGLRDVCERHCSPLLAAVPWVGCAGGGRGAGRSWGRRARTR